LENSYNNGPHVNSGKSLPPAKKKRNPTPRPTKPMSHHTLVHLPGSSASSSNILSDGHMTPEEVERHLQSQNYVELVPERAPPTVPTEMFSNEPSLDR
jgi:INO80 complex subunit E